MKASSQLNIVQVPFHGDSIDAVQTSDGKIMVSLKRVCESLGVSHQVQQRKLKTCKWATVTIMMSVAEDGKSRGLTMIDSESLPLWLVTVSPSKVKAQVREKLLQYQREAKAVLSAWFLGTSAERPDLAREFSEIKKRLTYVEGSLSLFKEKNRQLSCEMKTVNEEVSLIHEPFQADGNFGAYLTLRDYCLKYAVKNRDGKSLRGDEIRIHSKRVAAISRSLGVSVCKTEGGAFGQINCYRLDILHSWRSIHDLKNLTDEPTFAKLTEWRVTR